MVTQLRPAGQDKFYSPQRDIAYIGAHVLSVAMRAADKENREDWYQKFLDDNNIDEDALDAAAHLFFKGAVTVIEMEHPVVAMENSGFAMLPGAEQLAIYGKVGQVFLAALWSGIKDVSSPESDPPATITDMLRDIETAIREKTDGA